MDIDEKKKCFIISPIGIDGSPERERSDKVLEYIIEPVLLKCNYIAIRVDKENTPGVILNSIIQQLIEAPIAIADLTGKNPNVFYELAVRHVIGKPVIQIIQQGESIPFDIAATHVISLDMTDIVNQFKVRKQIEEQIKKSEENPGGAQYNPFGVANQILTLLKSNAPNANSFAEIIESIQDLRGIISSIQTDIINSNAELSKKQANQIISIITNHYQPFTYEEFEKLRNADVQIRVADNFLAEGKHQIALDYYEKVLKQFKDNQFAIIGKCKVLRKKSMEEKNVNYLIEAINLLSICIDKHPLYERAYYNRACYRCLNGEELVLIYRDLEEAVRLFEGYKDLAKDDLDFKAISTKEEFIKIVS